jgi:hypothetical protein
MKSRHLIVHLFAHRPNAVTEDQPAGLGFNRGAAIPYLDEFPGEGRLEKDFLGIPEVDMVGEHEIDVLVIRA